MLYRSPRADGITHKTIGGFRSLIIISRFCMYVIDLESSRETLNIRKFKIIILTSWYDSIQNERENTLT